MSIGDPMTLGDYHYLPLSEVADADISANRTHQLTWGDADVIVVRNRSDTYSLTLNLPVAGFSGYGGCIIMVDGQAGGGVYVGPAGSVAYSRERLSVVSSAISHDYTGGVHTTNAYPIAISTGTRQGTQGIARFVFVPRPSSDIPPRWYVIH